MNLSTPGSQVRDEDEAARLRDEGRSWSLIAQELAVTETVARNLAEASYRRVDDLHQRQGSLFDI